MMEEHMKILSLAEKNELPDQIDKNFELSVDIFKELYDEGYVEAIDASSMDGIAYLEPRITMAGREFLNETQSANLTENHNEGLEMPKTITLSWLFHKAPVKLWIGLIGLLLASFVLGAQSSRLSLVKEILNLPN